MKDLTKVLFGTRTREERVNDAIDHVIRTIHSEQYNFTVQEQTAIIQGVREKQIYILENQADLLHKVYEQINHLKLGRE